MRLNADERHLRPGGTVSGPSLFTLADIGGYVCVLSHAGPDALSVTTNLNINFVRKAEAGPIDGHCRILKLGKSLMVFDIDIVCRTERTHGGARHRHLFDPAEASCRCGKIIPFN